MSRERQLEEVEVVEPPAEQEIPAFSRTTSGEGESRLVETGSGSIFERRLPLPATDLLALYKRRPGAPAAPNLLADASSRDRSDRNFLNLRVLFSWESFNAAALPCSAADRKSRWMERLRRYR